MKTIQKNVTAQECVEVFLSQNSSVDSVSKAGMQFFVILYGGTQIDDLPLVRYTTYMRMTAVAARPVPEQLPLAPIFIHSLRTYMQVQQCKSLSTTGIDPLEWVWSVFKDQHLYPETTDEPPEPDSILQVVGCQ